MAYKIIPRVHGNTSDATRLDRLRWQIVFPHICPLEGCAICRWVRDHEWKTR